MTKNKGEELGRLIHQLSKDTDYSVTHIRNLLKKHLPTIGAKRKPGSNRWLVPLGSYGQLKRLVIQESSYRRILGETKGE